MQDFESDESVLDLQYCEVAFKASHNSYDKLDFSLANQLSWDPGKATQFGCRGLDLDVIQNPDTEDLWQWSAAHGGKYSKARSDRLSTWLAQIAGWWQSMDDERGPVKVHIDLKVGHGRDADFCAAIDSKETAVLDGATIYPAYKLLGKADSLLAAVKANGWPTIRQLYGKLLLCLTGDDHDRTDAYIADLVDGGQRICFCDREITDALINGETVTVRSEPNRIINNYDDTSQNCVMPDTSAIPGSQWAVFRAYGVPQAYWPRAVEEGSNMLSMDHLKLGSRAIGDQLYVKAANR